MRLYEQIRENIVRAGKYRKELGYRIKTCFNCDGRGYVRHSKTKAKISCGWCNGAGNRWGIDAPPPRGVIR